MSQWITMLYGTQHTCSCGSHDAIWHTAHMSQWITWHNMAHSIHAAVDTHVHKACKCTLRMYHAYVALKRGQCNIQVHRQSSPRRIREFSLQITYTSNSSSLQVCTRYLGGSAFVNIQYAYMCTCASWLPLCTHTCTCTCMICRQLHACDNKLSWGLRR